jgi:hypothetical protein
MDKQAVKDTFFDALVDRYMADRCGGGASVGQMSALAHARADAKRVLGKQSYDAVVLMANRAAGGD